MQALTIEKLFALVGAACALTWIPVLAHLLSQSRAPWREYVLPPLLLAVVALVPTGVTFASTGRASYTGSGSASLSRLLGGLYLIGVAFLLASLIRKRSRATTGGAICILLVLYWSTGALSDYVAGNGVGRVSFFLVPVTFFAAWRLRPRYDDAVGVLCFVTVAACAASLLLAMLDPSSAFGDASRSDRWLFSHRLAGVFEHPNAMGLFASIGLVLSWRSGAWLRPVGVPICGLALVASDSRNGWFGAAAAACVLFAGRVASRGQTPDRPGAGSTYFRVLLGGGLAALVALGIATYAVPSGQLHGFTGRTAIWQFVLNNWSEAPIIGHGPAIWSRLIAEGKVPPYAGQAHGQFFETLFTTGLVGEIFVAGILLVFTRNTLRAARAGYWLPLALESLIVAYGMLETPLSFWAIGGTVWLLSLVLFLDPVADQMESVEETELLRQAADDRWAFRPTFSQR